MTEQWKDIPGWEGYYQASNLGQIRSVGREIICNAGSRKGYVRFIKGRNLIPCWTGRYYKVNLSEAGGASNANVHKLVASTWIGEVPNGHQVLHGENGQRDNSVLNLRYGTPSDNQLDRREFGNQSNVRPVRRSDGLEFDSIREAAKATDSNASRIVEVCKGRRKVHHKFQWEYI